MPDLLLHLAIALLLLFCYIGAALLISHMFGVRAVEVAAWAAVGGVALNQARRLSG